MVVGSDHGTMQISVVIPAYNAALYIERSVRSVMQQTYADWELIVVDDGSVDETAAIVASVDDPRVRVIRQQNGGVSAARNRGVQEAKNEWIAFLDADDEWLPEFLEFFVQAITAYPESVAVFSNLIDSATGRNRLPYPPQKIGPLEDYFSFALQNRGLGMDASAVVVRRKAFEAVGGFPVGVRIGEDTDMWVRLAWSGEVVCIPETLAIYYSDIPTSASNQPRARSLVYPELAHSYRRWLREGKIPHHLQANSRRYAGYHLFWYLAKLIEDGRAYEAREVLRREPDMLLDRPLALALRCLLVLPDGLAAKLWMMANKGRRRLRG